MTTVNYNLFRRIPVYSHTLQRRNPEKATLISYLLRRNLFEYSLSRELNKICYAYVILSVTCHCNSRFFPLRDGPATQRAESPSSERATERLCPRADFEWAEGAVANPFSLEVLKLFLYNSGMFPGHRLSEFFGSAPCQCRQVGTKPGR